MEQVQKYGQNGIPATASDVGSAAIVNIEDYAMPLDNLVKQVALIQNAMKKVMKEGEHYGVIPGTPKPTLLKPGAEKLCLLFRLGPRYQIIEKVRQDRFIAYTVNCDLIHTPTGTFVASGIGSCNSYEAKYRYRTEETGREVPKEYWETRDPELLGGPEYKPRKKGGKWVIVHQVENDNPWDLDNTLIKMACKRALIAAVLNATAASDIFTQDIEDMPEIHGTETVNVRSPDRQQPPVEGSSPSITFMELAQKIENAKHINHLKNIWEKYKGERKRLTDAEKEALAKMKDAKKRELEMK